jgi:hypothetical protein
MDFSIVILVVAVAAVAYFVWNQRKGAGPSDQARPMPPAPAASTPVSAPVSAAPVASAANAAARAAPAAAGSAAASYDEYRRVSPSNMVYGKLTCNRCGSNLIRVEGGTAGCTTCGAALYRA